MVAGLAVAVTLSAGAVFAAGGKRGNLKVAPTSPEAVSGDRAEIVVSGKLDDSPGTDLALQNSFEAVAILSGQGGGDFTETGTEAVGQAPVQVAVADLDGVNGKDLAVASRNAGNLTVLLNDGTGNFAAAPTSPEDTNGGGVAAADFDGDQDIDLATGTNSSPGTGIVLLNDGTGDFTAGDGFSSPITDRLASADFDDDGDPDLAASGAIADTALVSFNDGDGNLTEPIALPSGATGDARTVAVGKANGDEFFDIAVAKSGGVDVFLSDGEGDFDRSPDSPASGPGESFGDVAIADLDRNGRKDLLVGGVFSGDTGVSVFLNRKSGFKEPLTSPEAVAAGIGAPWLALGKFDDRKGLDVAAASGSGGAVRILLNRSPVK